MKKAKILLLTHACTVGGAEMHILSLARNLNKEKYDITLGYFIERPPDDAHPMKDDFLGCGIKVIDFKGRKKFDVPSFYRAIKHIKNNSFDIIHSHLFRADITGGISSLRRLTPILISTVHSTEEFLKNPFFAVIQRFIVRMADQIIVISDAVDNYLVETTNIRTKKTKRIYYGIDNISEDIQGDNIRRRYGIDNNIPLIGMIGRYAPQKGHKYLLEAMVEVVKVFPDTRLFLAGHDEKCIKISLVEYAQKLGIKKNVIFSGFRPDVLNIIQQLDIFVLSSLWEGFGLVLLEAMRCRKAIVATNVGPIPEVVLDKKTGFLVEPKDPAKMAEKIIFLLNNREIAEEMGKRGKERVEQYFTISKMIEDTEEVYDYWLNRKQGMLFKNRETLHESLEKSARV